MLSTYLQQPIHSSSSRYDVDGNGSIEFAEMKRVKQIYYFYENYCILLTQCDNERVDNTGTVMKDRSCPSAISHSLSLCSLAEVQLPQPI